MSVDFYQSIQITLIREVLPHWCLRRGCICARFRISILWYWFILSHFFSPFSISKEKNNNRPVSSSPRN